ncbi:integrase catalytic domain-containing protein [Trichonephila clavipes]|nr:integrase catalytic domain-containing protein [Trichonephila clavipes]
MSSDFNDFAVLTLGHFLIGRPLQSLPEQDTTDKLDNRLSQWQKLTKFVQFIWCKWRLDYLNNLQARHKWQFEKENVTPNSMVILKDENLPPCKWPMGRILEIVKSSDGKVRVLKVKTPHGDDKPSHLPRKMKELFGGQLQDEFLKNLWLQRLPSQIQAVLSISMETFDKLAEIADVALLTAVYSATSAPEPNTSAEIQELAK